MAGRGGGAVGGQFRCACSGCFWKAGRPRWNFVCGKLPLFRDHVVCRKQTVRKRTASVRDSMAGSLPPESKLSLQIPANREQLSVLQVCRGLVVCVGASGGGVPVSTFRKPS